MAYQSTSWLFRSLDDDEEKKFREYAREHLEEIRGRILDGSVSIIHPVCRDEFSKITGENCPGNIPPPLP